MRLALVALVLCPACAAPGVPPLPWQRGELVIEQVDLPGWIGASTLVVGPDGTSVLIDVGNDRHHDEVVEAVDRHLGQRHVDHVLLTHWHADHVGGFDKIVEDGLDVGSIVSRGVVEADAATQHEVNEVMATDAWNRRVSLCMGDEGCTLPFRIDLGDGAWLEVVAANGEAWDGEAVVDFGDIEENDSGENARSLAGVVGWGAFRYVFAGDLTGGGKGSPDVESFLAETLPDALVPPTGADLVQLSHHGIDSSTYDAWMDRLLPEDGAQRNAIVGSNGGYLDAPANEVLDRLRDRIDGVWLTRPGAMTGDDDLLRTAKGAVAVRVGDGGATYDLEAGEHADTYEAVGQ